MKLYKSEEYGAIYWVDNGVLCFEPLPAGNGEIDTDMGGEVEFHLLPEEETKKLKAIKDNLEN